MKLIIRQYLAALRERDELDAILPDLLSQLGLNVFSRPGRGTRQQGVDVAAVGKLDGRKQKVFLFSVKAGDLTRQEWDGSAVQSLRPSLNEILDAYIPNRLPAEHRDKEVVICICVGGEITEQVQDSLEGYVRQNTRAGLSFERWNGDLLADLIQQCFLREELLPAKAQSQLRKSLAMLDEPDTSYRHFAALIRSLSAVNDLRPAERLRAMRQMSICLWVLFSWGRDEENLEAPYRAAELALLHGWQIARLYIRKSSKVASNILAAYDSIFIAYQQICSEYLSKCVLPHADKRDGISSAVHAACALDVNLKLFDQLGRLAVDGIWSYHLIQCLPEPQNSQESLSSSYSTYSAAVKNLIGNNPTLFLPVRDDQAIDLCLAVFLLALDPDNRNDIESWLKEIVARSKVAHHAGGAYPCTLQAYRDLLEHPRKDDDEYRRDVTQGSILFPMIALFAALWDLEELYRRVAQLKNGPLAHCNFQFWYPSEDSEEHLYANSDGHGATMAVDVSRPREEFLEQAFAECEQLPHFNRLSTVRFRLWPLVLVACRHYRLPVPLHLFQDFRKEVFSGKQQKSKRKAKTRRRETRKTAAP